MANFDLDGFIGKNADFARGYTFYISLADPTGVTSELQKFLVRSSTLPASTITPAEVNWQGNAYKIGTTQEFADFTVTYSVDVDSNIRKGYETWVEKIHNVLNNEHGDPVEYMSNITLDHISHRTGKSIMTYKLVKAWPSNVGEMTLDYASKDVATFDVTFTYQYHVVDANAGLK